MSLNESARLLAQEAFLRARQCQVVELSALDQALEVYARSCGFKIENLSTIHFTQTAVFYNKKNVYLTQTQLRLVHILHAHSPQVVSYKDMLKNLHPEYKVHQDQPHSRATIRTLIKHIRAKFMSIDPAFDYIKASPGIGYSWQDA